MTEQKATRWKDELKLLGAAILGILCAMGTLYFAIGSLALLGQGNVMALFVFLTVPMAVVCARASYLSSKYASKNWNVRARKW
uniref:Uncharacterized protein n=1 Tax=Pseudomonas phage RVTF4 TaxID=3236931 RepID=A0AB39CCA9_9VIRU